MGEGGPFSKRFSNFRMFFSAAWRKSTPRGASDAGGFIWACDFGELYFHHDVLVRASVSLD